MNIGKRTLYSLPPFLTALLVFVAVSAPNKSLAFNGGNVDTIKVSKCYTNATATSYGQMLIKASSSDSSAHLYAYRPDGTYQGEVQNGGGGRYGGTVMGYVPCDPGFMIIISTSGGRATPPTTPFQP